MSTTTKAITSYFPKRRRANWTCSFRAVCIPWWVKYLAMSATSPNHAGVAGTDCGLFWIVAADCAILVMRSPDRASEYSSLVQETHLFLRPCLAQDKRRGDREIRGNQNAFPHTDGTTSLGKDPSPKTADSRIREIRRYSAGARTGGDSSQAQICS
jgi:hypothetical protein